MNSFDLKAALPARHAAPHLACVVRSAAVTFLPASCYFLTTIRNISRVLQSVDMHAGVLAFLETTN